jgi:hypothetical protein
MGQPSFEKSMLVLEKRFKKLSMSPNSSFLAVGLYIVSWLLVTERSIFDILAGLLGMVVHEVVGGVMLR